MILAASAACWIGSTSAQDLQGTAPVDPTPVIEHGPEERSVPPPPRVTPVPIVEPTADFRMTRRVIFVVDVSGSMRGKLQDAIDSVLMIASAPTDDFRVAVIAFSGSHTRWEGIPECIPHGELDACSERCILSGWAAMPDGYRSLLDWLGGLRASGNTSPAAPLDEALREPEEELTIVFVTDGQFAENEVPPGPAIQRAQEWRTEHGFPRAAVMVWGVGNKAWDVNALQRIAEGGGGGFWVAAEDSPY